MQPPPLFLTPEELRALTGRARAQDQIAVLRALVAANYREQQRTTTKEAA